VEAIFQNVSTVHDLRSFCCVAGDTSLLGCCISSI